jgi:hypothetical protein
VHVLLGVGDGTFTAGWTVQVPGISFGPTMGVGDLNGDGKLDLVVQGDEGATTVLLGSGDGTFVIGASLTTQTGISMAVADYNNDGNADLAVGSASGVSVYPGAGDGSFGAGTTGLSGIAVGQMSAGDWNGDGVADLAVIDPGTDLVSMLLGNGDGTFTAQAPVVSFARNTADIPGIGVGDFNGDGRLDLVLSISAPGYDGISFFAGQGDGTFTPQVAAENPLAPALGVVALGDFNGDGIADLAVTGQSILYGKGDGTFPSGLVMTQQHQPAVVAADWNGDGLSDVVFANEVSSGALQPLSVYLSQGGPQSTATLSPVALAGTGQHSVVAKYSGDSVYTGSTSIARSLTAQAVTTGLTLTALPAGTTFGQQVTLVATLSPYSVTGYGTDGELVTFLDGGVSLGTGALRSGVASLNVASLVVGSHSMAASYAGEGNFAAAKSAAVSVMVSQAASTTSVAVSGSNQTLTARVASVSGVPTGTVSFYEGTTLVGIGTLANGVASFVLSAVPAANVALSATYAGDANFAGSSSTAVTLLTVGATSGTLTAGKTGSVTDVLNVAVAPGYAGTVQFACSGLPTGATCSFAPSTVTFSGTGTTGSVTLTIQTGVTTTAMLEGDRRGMELAAVIGLPGLLLAGIGGRRRGWAGLLMLAMLFGVGAGLVGCAGGSPAATTAPATVTTPAGTSNVVVTATGTGGLSLTTNVTLTVQ